MNSTNATHHFSCHPRLPGRRALPRRHRSRAGRAGLATRESIAQRLRRRASKTRDHPVLRETARQLREYFAGSRRTFDLPLEFRGTEFQRRAWSALLTIPYGETRTLRPDGGTDRQSRRGARGRRGERPQSDLDHRPCHRVIGMSGDLTGFGGGLDAKAYLLSLEAPQQQLLAG
mgnify:CR=1 FL=1